MQVEEVSQLLVGGLLERSDLCAPGVVEFLSLPPEAGPMRDYWLALDARGGRAPRIGGVVASAEETHEAVANGEGVVLLAAGNAPLIARDNVVCLPVRGVSPSELAVAARRDDERPLVRAYLAGARELAESAEPRSPR
ncbi:LysR substrate-binding domain-containing protein [Streptomyces sp. NPDC048590]|uniref:LysR substrate-binding domain-containing protein n=1 Tax=Streptomyces sp. NPDC048590 TaxID=3365574 RepID=UPI0037117DA0